MIKTFKTAFLFGTILSATLLGAACGGKSSAESKANKNNNANAQPQIVDVSVAPAIQRELPQYFEATGTLASDAQTDVAPTVGGKVIAVNFDVGGYVNRGDVLVRLDSRDAELRLEQANAAVAQSESGVNNARAGVGTALSNLNQTRATLGLGANENFDANNVAEVKNARAVLELAEKQLRRFERLLESGDVPRQQYDQQRAQRDQARAAFEVALNGANQRFAGIRTAQSQVEAARSQVASAQSAVDAARTQIASANKAIADAIVRAPISGSILERNADLGEFASTSNKVATIVRTNPIRARIEIPEGSISNVRIGQTVSLNASSYPDQQFSGRIARIIPGLNTQSRTLIAEAEVNNINGQLKPGQFVTARVLLPEARPVTMVPVRAVRTEGTTSRVFVVRDGRAEERLVQTGETESDLIEVRGNIASSDRVIVSNLEALFDGVEVRQ